MRRPEDTLDPLVERELAALDAALAGEPVDPDLAVSPSWRWPRGRRGP